MRGFPLRLLTVTLCGLCGLLGATVAPVRAVQQPPPMTVGPGGTSAAAVASGNGITFQVLEFGLRNRARAGDWIPVRLTVADSSATTREIVLRLSIADADGDTVQFQRAFTPTATPRPLWLYARLPFSVDTQTTFVFTAHAITSRADASDEGGALTVGPPLARLALTTASVVSAERGMIGVLGRQTALLDRYARTGAQEFLVAGHEPSDVLSGMQINDLPDRWMGLSGLSELVWTGSGDDGDPRRLDQQRAEALIEWVHRGGHLVIIVPGNDPQWSDRTHPLRDILPKVQMTREERVSLAPLVPLLRGPVGQEEAISPPTAANLTVFTPLPDASPSEATPILAGPDGKVVVVRRTLGVGAVTLVGVDLTTRVMAGANILQADTFWHRVFGRRGELLTEQEAKTLSDKQNAFFGSRIPVPVDHGIAAMINKTGQAAAGVLLAFVVFGAYWAIAGPLGVFVLGRRSLSHLAWLGFVVVAGVFTLVAWLGAGLLRPRSTDALHVTFLDAVVGQPVQRARTYFTAFLPAYGDMTVGIAREQPTPGALVASPVNALSVFSQPSGSTSTSFLDARGYPVDSARPDAMTVPVRATVKSMVADWLGPVNWKLPLPVMDPAAPQAAIGVRSVLRPLNPNGPPTVPGLEGVLRNELPGPLRDVVLIHVLPQARLGAPATTLRFRAQAYSIPEWQQGAVLNLADVTTPRAPGSGGDGRTAMEALLEGVVPTSSGFRGAQAPLTMRQFMLASSFFSVLPPPDYRTIESDAGYQRTLTHGLDISRWLTQPCVVVLGVLGDADAGPSPTPLTVNGEPLASAGRTVLRLIYPLPGSPPELPAATAGEKPGPSPAP